MSNFDEFPLGLNPYQNDQGAWGASLINNAELVLSCLETARTRSVLEVGAYAGDFTRLLLRWAESSRASIVAVDPSPQPELEQLEAEHAELTLIRRPSPRVLHELERLPEAIVLDGDHNYHTVTHELQAVEERSASGFPLVLLHDVSWPHGRRDDYFNPAEIPPDHRQPIVADALLYPGIQGTHTGGLRYAWAAAQEGGPHNGVLTAIEDFVSLRDHLRLIVIPTFFGLGVLFAAEASYSSELTALLAGWDRHKLLSRLERNRVLHLASSQVQLQLYMEAQERVQEMERLLGNMLHSRAFSLAELWTRLRERRHPPFSRMQIRRLMDRRRTWPVPPTEPSSDQQAGLAKRSGDPPALT